MIEYMDKPDAPDDIITLAQIRNGQGIQNILNHPSVRSEVKDIIHRGAKAMFDELYAKIKELKETL